MGDYCLNRGSRNLNEGSEQFLTPRTLTNVSGLALLPVRHIGFERAPAQCALALSAAHLHTAHELFNSEYFLVFSRTFSVYNVDLK